jgi:hypothetical protein
MGIKLKKWGQLREELKPFVIKYKNSEITKEECENICDLKHKEFIQKHSPTIKIFEVLVKNKNSHVDNTLSLIREYKSFEEYLNLLAVERIEFPYTYKIITRSYDIGEEKMLAEIYDTQNNISYKLFAEVVKSID